MANQRRARALSRDPPFSPPDVGVPEKERKPGHGPGKRRLWKVLRVGDSIPGKEVCICVRASMYVEKGEKEREREAVIRKRSSWLRSSS